MLEQIQNYIPLRSAQSRLSALILLPICLVLYFIYANPFLLSLLDKEFYTTISSDMILSRDGESRIEIKSPRFVYGNEQKVISVQVSNDSERALKNMRIDASSSYARNNGSSYSIIRIPTSSISFQEISARGTTKEKVVIFLDNLEDGDEIEVVLRLSSLDTGEPFMLLTTGSSTLRLHLQASRWYGMIVLLIENIILPYWFLLITVAIVVSCSFADEMHDSDRRIHLWSIGGFFKLGIVLIRATVFLFIGTLAIVTLILSRRFDSEPLMKWWWIIAAIFLGLGFILIRIRLSSASQGTKTLSDKSIQIESPPSNQMPAEQVEIAEIHLDQNKDGKAKVNNRGKPKRRRK